MLGSNRDTKAIRIPVRFTDGGIVLLDGRPLPEIRKGSIGELRLSEYAVEDSELIEELQVEVPVEILPAGQTVCFSIRAGKVPAPLWKKACNQQQIVDGPEGPCVKVRLEASLKLRLRGSKTPALCPCRCKISCLRNMEAKSLNHAYTLVSRHFEKDRISHSGNVFELGFWYDRTRQRWVRLDDLRTAAQIERGNDGRA